MRFGLIGCGGIGELRAEAIALGGADKLVAVCDVEEDRARALAGKYGCHREKKWSDLIRRKDLDAIIVSTPPSLHAPMSIDALNHGKHVLCEKPLARNSQECQSMVEAAKANTRLLATGFNYRFYPSILKAKELVDSGLIGEISHIRSYAGYTAMDHNPAWVHDVDVMGGGALRDNGIHLIDLTCFFLGDVAEVKGFTTGSVWDFKGCEDNGFALLRNSKGVVAMLQASWTEWRGYQFLIEIYGEKGCIRTRCFPIMTQVIWADERGGRPHKKTYLFPKTFLFEHLRSYRWVVAQSFVKEFHAFSQAVNGESSAVANGKDGLRAIKIAEMASDGRSEFGGKALMASAG